MNFLRKLSILAVFLLFSVWVLPVLGHVIPFECSCCAKAECCCGCKGNDTSDIDNGHSKSSPCKCSISNNNSFNDTIFLSSKTVDNRILLVISNTLEEQSSSGKNPLIEVKYTNNHPIILSLFLLKSSFLL
jgi:hypothetical protein